MKRIPDRFIFARKQINGKDMVHSRYTGFGPNPMVIVDILRVRKGKLVEHWDIMQEEVPADKSANGNTMFPIR